MRILASVGFCVTTCMAGMAIISSFPGMALPLGWWLFGFFAPLSTATLVCTLLTRQVARNEALNVELRTAFDAMRQLAEIDAMTGLLNRSTFLDAMEVARIKGPGTCLLIDVDHFKAINDQHGHAAGDAVLRTIGTQMRDAVRASDLCGRMGGEEFAIYLPGVTGEQTAIMAERVRAAIEALRVTTDDGACVRPTISVGAIEARADMPIERVLRDADQAMYRAKHGGRNRVRFAA